MTSLRNIARDVVSLRILAPAARLPVLAALGVMAGAAILVLHVSRATSYLSDSPETCMNCHVMTTAYVTWQHSSHGRDVTCNDCHVPHDSVVRQYGFKAKDGLWHATVFTMRWEPQVIRLSEGAVPVVEANCRRCHGQVVNDVTLAAHRPGDLRCWACHRETPHGRVQSLSATPGVFQPQLPPAEQRGQEPTIGGRVVRPKESH